MVDASVDRFRYLMRQLLPNYSRTQYKGQNGKVAVIGGSMTYTGAPYFVAMASLRTGSDLAFIYCHENAAIPIKSYSPELIVTSIFQRAAKESQIRPALDIAKSLVVGPGLGRTPFAKEVFLAWLSQNEAILQGVPQDRAFNFAVVLDADALWHLSTDYDQVIAAMKQLASRQTQILTPNLIEFRRLWQAQYPELDSQTNLPSVEDEMAFHTECLAFDPNRTFFKIDVYHQVVRPVAEMARSFGNAILVRKGITDIVTDGNEAYFVAEEGSLKRCGGIGDILAGTIASFQQFPRHELQRASSALSLQADIELANSRLAPAVLACVCVRRASRGAFFRKRHSLVCTDIFEDLQDIIIDVTFEEEQLKSN